MTFKDYIRFKNPICNLRSINAIYRYNIDQHWTIDSLISLASVGRKTANDIINLQRKYKKRSNKICQI